MSLILLAFCGLWGITAPIHFSHPQKSAVFTPQNCPHCGQKWSARRKKAPGFSPAFSPLSRRFLAAASKIARFFHFCRFLISVAERIIPSAVCSTFATPATLPHGGATCGFEASGGYALGCAAKAPQTADTGATAWERCFACLLNLCSSSNRRISALPHPRSASASAGHSPVGALPESAEL